MLGNENISLEELSFLQATLATHERAYAEAKHLTRNNMIKYRESDYGKEKIAAYVAKRGKKEKAARKAIKSTGNSAKAIAKLPHVENWIKKAKSNGFALAFDAFTDIVARSYNGASLLAALATDGYVDHVTGRMEFDLQMRDVYALSHTMRSIREFSQGALKAVRSYAKAPKFRMLIRFESRDRKTKSTTIGTGFALDDEAKLDYAERTGEAGYALRKAIYGLHKEIHGHDLKARSKLSLAEAPNPPVRKVRSLVRRSDLPRVIKDELLSILDDPSQSFKKRAILNGSIFLNVQSSQSFPWHHCYAKLGLGSSKTKSNVNLSALRTILRKVEANGLCKRKFARHWIAAWAGFDGSITPFNFELLIDNSPKMIKMFDILTALAFGDNSELNPGDRSCIEVLFRVESDPDVINEEGKSILRMRTARHHLPQIYTTLDAVMSDWIPRRKQEVCRMYRQEDSE